MRAHTNIALSLAAALTLASCGAPQGATGARIVSGTITAMSADRSSITVQGQTFKVGKVAAQGLNALRSTSVRVNGKSATAKSLSVGQRVRLNADGDEVSDVDVDLELKGSVSSIDAAAGSLVVAGKTVTVTASTRFDVSGDEDDDDSASTGSLASIKVGDFVEVTGATDPASGAVSATKIEVKSNDEINGDGEDRDHEFKGTVANLSGNSFNVGKVQVTCASPCALPAGLKNGDFVEVEGALTVTGPESDQTVTVAAKSVKLEDGEDGEHGGGEEGEHAAKPGAAVTLEDNVRNLNATAKTFTMEGFTVDYSAAAVTGTLADRAKVKLEGTVDTSNTRLVRASKVTVRAGEGR